jgi:uncharacterized protein YfaS (alpha-2-macroglobulin family)
MKNQSRLYLLVASTLFVFLIAACGPVTPVLSSSTPEKLSVEVTPAAYPQVVNQIPLPNERLGLSPEIRVGFDRPMDKAKTEAAWAFLDADGKPIAGKLSWADEQTLQFKPEKTLEPSASYSAVISTSAAAADGSVLPQEIKLEYQTTNELAVNQIFPADGTEDVDSQSAITVIFNKPVVALMSKEDLAKQPSPIEITPALKGSGDWVSSSVYVFKPDTGLNSGASYLVRVRSGLKDTTGVELKQAYASKFSTSFPFVADFELKSQGKDFSESVDSVLLDQAFMLTFSCPMEQKSVEQAVSLSNVETGAKFPMKLTWNDKSTKLTLTPVGNYSIDSFYDLSIDTSAKAQDGGAFKEAYHQKVSTITLPAIESVSPDAGKQASFSSYLRIQFKTPMNPESLKDKVKITPEPAKPFKFVTGSRSLTVYGLQPSTSYVVRILPGMADIYGNTIKDSLSRSFETAALQPYANLGAGNYALIYRPEGEKTIFFDYTNLDSAKLELYSIPFEDIAASLADYDTLQRMVNREDNPLRGWDLSLTAEKNKFGRIPVDLDKGGQLKPGYYYLRSTWKLSPYSVGNQETGDYSMVSLSNGPKSGNRSNAQGALLIVASDNLTLKTTSTEALAWLVDQETGQPTPNVPVVFYDRARNMVGKATTDENGLAYAADAKDAAYARTDDSKHLAMTSTDWGSGVYPGQFGIWTEYYAPLSNAFADIYTERPLYRPGQAVEYKGILRLNDDLHYSLPTQAKVSLRIENDQGKVFEGNLGISKNGTFSGEFKLGDDAMVGNYYVSVRNAASDEEIIGGTSFRVAEYRKPEFEVTMDAVPDTVLAGEQVKFSLDATYYSGGSVSNASVDWYMEAHPYYYTPPADYNQYSFNSFDYGDYYGGESGSGSNPMTQQGTDATDAKGHFELTQAATLQKQDVSQQTTFSANVGDVGGSVVGGQVSMVTLVSAVHVGINSEEYVGEKGKPSTFNLVVLDLDGKPVANSLVSLEFAEQRWYSVVKEDDDGVSRWETSVKTIPSGSATATTDEKGLATVTFAPPNGGEFKAVVTAKDDKGRPSKASTYLWVSSQSYVPWQQTNDRSFDLVLDKSAYNPGETAKILIAQPFEGENYALVTLERGHIYEKKVVKLETNSTVYELPITKDMAPVMYISVVVVKGAEGKAPADFKVGMKRIDVNPSQQQITVNLESDKKDSKPGDTVTYTVTTKDLAGKPVQADVSLALVDKAVLALAPSNSQPLVDAFYPVRGVSVTTASGIVLNAEDFNTKFQETMPTGDHAGSGGGGEKGEGAGIITVRGNFKDTAFWQAQVLTDEEGAAQVQVTLPDNLTTWRMTARAVTDDTRVGETTHEITSNRPMYVQLQTPRFFVVDDKVRIGAVVHNNTGSAMTATVTLKAEGVTLQSDATQKVDVPSKQQAYVTWDVTVKKDATRVDLTADATGGGYSDATQPTLGTLPGNGIPVLTYHVTETVGSSGALREKGSTTESVLMPQSTSYLDANLVVEASPSLAASMTDGLTYLNDYPYLCMEQTVSRFLPNLISVRALKLAGKSTGDLQKSLDEQVRPALQRINNNQNGDGGWGLWPGNESSPTTTAYVILGLVEARESGYTVSDNVLRNGMTYLYTNLPSITQAMDGWQKNRAAFMLYALARGGESNPGKLNELLEYDNNLGLYARAFLLQSMFLSDANDPRIKDLLSTLNNAVAKSAAGAWWDEKETDYWNWNTDVRTTAIVLNTLIQVDPNNPLIADGIRWLMKHRDASHWYSTQETAWSLMTLTNWLTLSKEFETDYSFALGLNGNLLDNKLASKDNLFETTILKVGVEKFLADQTNYLVLTRGDGPGVLYYTAYMDYSLPVKDIQPLDQGILVTRQYFNVEDPKTPVTEVQRGDLVQVRLTMVVPDSLHYLVIDDPLPAGLEAVDSSLQTSTQVPETYQPNDYARYGWGWWYFYYKQIYDDKLVMSADYLPAGTYTITYIARASSVGDFHVLPVTAKEFYFPVVSGRSAGSVFTVKP